MKTVNAIILMMLSSGIAFGTELGVCVGTVGSLGSCQEGGAVFSNFSGPDWIGIEPIPNGIELKGPWLGTETVSYQVTEDPSMFGMVLEMTGYGYGPGGSVGVTEVGDGTIVLQAFDSAAGLQAGAVFGEYDPITSEIVDTVALEGDAKLGTVRNVFTPPSAIPEPWTVVMMGMGMLGIALKWGKGGVG